MIGVYVHHQGVGHLHRVASVLERLDDEATVFTSARVPDGVLPAHVSLAGLPTDVPGVDEVAVDPTAGGALHWAPLGVTGYRERMRRIVEWVGRTGPSAFWVDVSVEVLLAVRLAGVPVVGTLMPGIREDAPHQTGFGVADELLAAWPPGAHPAAVAATGRGVHEVGGVSRFEHRERGRRRTGVRPLVVRLHGAGGAAGDNEWDEVRRELDEVDWVVLGGPRGRWEPDPWQTLGAADVVVGATGQGTVADLACLDGHVVLVPEDRPFGEQDATAAALRGVPGVTVCGRGAQPRELATSVRAAVTRARDEPASGFRAAWGVDGAADRAAGLLRAAGDGGAS